MLARVTNRRNPRPPAKPPPSTPPVNTCTSDTVLSSARVTLTSPSSVSTPIFPSAIEVIVPLVR